LHKTATCLTAVEGNSKGDVERTKSAFCLFRGGRVATHLFAWNPKLYEWAELGNQIKRISEVGYADDRWSTGATKRLPAGSRFFFIKIGIEPKGIVGSGFTLSAPELRPHWDGEKRAAGVKYLSAAIRFDFLSNNVIVTLEELQQPPFAEFTWTLPSSGNKIKEPVAEALEAIWAKRTGASITIFPNEIPFSLTLPEGAKRQVTVNAYERSSAARSACIAHHGSRCKVCGIDLGETFGPIASGFIHVHHLIPLSAIRESYQVDPVKDLVPVCPTCHSILHLRKIPLSISEARGLLKAQAPTKR
jgi:5-methylcytosine-specific restriction protein A